MGIISKVYWWYTNLIYERFYPSHINKLVLYKDKEVGDVVNLHHYKDLQIILEKEYCRDCNFLMYKSIDSKVFISKMQFLETTLLIICFTILFCVITFIMFNL